MRKMRLAATVAAVLMATAAAAQAQGWNPPEDEAAVATPGNGEAVKALVEELRALVEEAERQRSADPRFLDRLRQLAARHTWPWNEAVLADEFRDGDYTRNPAWRVAAGEFWIDRQLGLRTSVGAPGAAASGGTAEDDDPVMGVLSGVLEELLREPGRNGRGTAAPTNAAAPAEIHIDTAFANAFALEVRLFILPGRSDGGGLYIGPYQGERRSSGYMVGVRPDGDRLTLELLRLRNGGSSVVAAQETALDRGARDPVEHVLLWTRAADGTMAVHWNGTRVIDTLDRGITRGFAGLRLVNEGGSYGVRRVALDTVDR